jgi:hypothetical protein
MGGGGRIPALVGVLHAEIGVGEQLVDLGERVVRVGDRLPINEDYYTPGIY